MTPAEALRRAQREFPPLHPSYSTLQEKAEELGLPIVAITEMAGYDRASALLSAVQEALPVEVSLKLAAGNVVVGEIGQPHPNAFIEKIGHDGYIIGLHSGLFEFIYRIARPVSATVFRVMGDTDEGLDRVELARVIAEIIWWQQTAGVSFGPDYPVTSEQIILAHQLAFHAEVFLLAHELGHIAAGESDEWHEPGMSRYEAATMEEHVADLQALGIVLRSYKPYGHESDGPSLALMYAGAEFALQIWRLMEMLRIPFVDGVHPPAIDRIVAMRTLLQQACQTEDDYQGIIVAAKLIDSLFDEVAELLNDPQEHINTLERNATALLDDFASLLRRCTGQQVPDYLTFYEKAPALLSRGYPEVVLREVFARIAGDFQQDMRKGPGGGESQRIIIDRFQSFKLLFGLIHRLPTPIAKIYKSALSVFEKQTESSNT